MKDAQEQVRQFLLARKNMLENNQDPHKVLSYLKTELEELTAEVEAGNVENVKHEIPDILFFALTLCEVYGIDAEDAFRTKVRRNEEKYQPEYFNNGMSYEEAALLCRALWSDKGGDEVFYSSPNNLDVAS